MFMCGRFSLMAVGEVLKDWFDLESVPELRPNYNAAPMQILPIITNKDPNHLTMAQWNLVPHWNKDSKSQYTMINAKVETLMEKPSYKVPFQRQRCLIPADGFYEWKKQGDNKQPFRITLKDNGLFAFAGIYDTFKDSEGKEVYSFSIITLPPNELVGTIHDRMPAILKREHEKLWINDTPVEKLIEVVLKPYPADEMKAYEILPLVNNVRYNKEDIILPKDKVKSLMDY